MRLGALLSLAANHILGLNSLPGLVVLVQRGSKTPSFAPPTLGLTFCTTCTGVAPGLHQPQFLGLSACTGSIYPLIAGLVLGANAGADFRRIGVVQVLKKRWCCTTRAEVLCDSNSEACENPGNPWLLAALGGHFASLTSYYDNLSVSQPFPTGCDALPVCASALTGRIAGREQPFRTPDRTRLANAPRLRLCPQGAAGSSNPIAARRPGRGSRPGSGKTTAPLQALARQTPLLVEGQVGPPEHSIPPHVEHRPQPALRISVAS